MAPTVPTDTINPPETARTDGPAASKDHQNRALASIYIYICGFVYSLLRPHDRNAGPSGNAPEAAKNTAIYRRFGDSTETRMAYPVMVRSVHTTMYTPRLRWRSDSHATRTEKQHATAYGGTVKSCGGRRQSDFFFLPPSGGLRGGALLTCARFAVHPRAFRIVGCVFFCCYMLVFLDRHFVLLLLLRGGE